MSTSRTRAAYDALTPRTVTTPRGSFAVLDAPVPSGTTRRGHVLLVPGWTGSKEDFAFVLPLLARAGWHATAYDQRGQYETAGKPDDDYSVRGFAADALALQEALAPHGRSHLVGHSFGGLVAQHAVLDDASAWRSLTLLCSGPAGFSNPDVAALADDPEASPRMLATFIAAVPTVGLEEVFERQHADTEVTPNVRAFLRSRFLASSPESLCAIAQHLIDAPDQVDALAATDVPVAVGRGSDDDAWPHASQDRLAERLGTVVEVIPGAGHSPAADAPEATAALLLGAWERLGV
ncbi:alpha/beta hydrolase [Mumia zhuanghuii]|uniref:Alpha/beta fold hydrolase n=2 Tax=Mumia TaxID=1546255 RepID=A0ABW1QHV3_9ACTN|nr:MULTISPECIES: alpha/beta fold hydrolase [Mumia]KAA1422620.1 alpha/beta hydrolase [Mumia zhuanghuii]